MARWHHREGGNHLDKESNRQTTMEDTDGGLHPAGDGQSLDERWDEEKRPITCSPGSQVSWCQWCRRRARWSRGWWCRRTPASAPRRPPPPDRAPGTTRGPGLACTQASRASPLLSPSTFPCSVAAADRLAGLVVKASASGVEDPGFKSRLRRDFSGVESYQRLKNWHSSGYPARRLAL